MVADSFPEPRRIDLVWIEARAPAGMRLIVQGDAPDPRCGMRNTPIPPVVPTGTG